jgi:hypothetical protein
MEMELTKQQLRENGDVCSQDRAIRQLGNTVGARVFREKLKSLQRAVSWSCDSVVV